MRSIFRVAFFFWIVSSNTVLGHGNHHHDEKSHTSYLETGLSAFGLCANVFGLAHTGKALWKFDRTSTQPRVKDSTTLALHWLNGLLTTVDLFTHCANLADYSWDLSNLVAEEEHSRTAGHSLRLLLLNSMSLGNHLLNVFLIKKKGWERLFHLHDLFEITAHANDIRANGVAYLQACSDSNETSYDEL